MELVQTGPWIYDSLALRFTHPRGHFIRLLVHDALFEGASLKVLDIDVEYEHIVANSNTMTICRPCFHPSFMIVS
jgi:hypothetical protein